MIKLFIALHLMNRFEMLRLSIIFELIYVESVFNSTIE